MNESIDIPIIRIIAVSGRIASGSTTLAKKLAKHFHWRHIEGGEIFWEAIRRKTGLDAKDTHLRADEEDALFDAELKRLLHEEKHIVLESKLAGFNAQGTDGVFKILVICENEQGEDQTQIRIDRLINREGVALEDAKAEVLEREKNDLDKWRHLYAKDDPHWVYFDRKYYDLVINTYSYNQEESMKLVLEKLGV